jgi:hypothetical protein
MMPNYKEMYMTMFRAAEDAENILIEAQRKCEELYISDDERDSDAPKLSCLLRKDSDHGS